jgi:GNAT superfamily N-acetyltransferase
MNKARNTGGASDSARLHIRPLEPGDWPVIVRLFGDNGACGGCWCMWPRVPRGGKAWEEAKGAKNRDRFRRLVHGGQVHGMLAFCGAEPAGWCSFGPRATFPRLETVRAIQRDWSDGTWSIVCFYIPARWRGRGVATRLLEAATARAFALGAREIEGYPAVPKRPPEPLPAAFAWTGVPAFFVKAGYEEWIPTEASRSVFVKLGRRRLN